MPTLIILSGRPATGKSTILGLPFVNVEVTCSDPAEHRRRVESRSTEVPGMPLPSWEEIFERERHPWDRERIVVDTAGRTPEECVDELAGGTAVTDPLYVSLHAPKTGGSSLRQVPERTP